MQRRILRAAVTHRHVHAGVLLQIDHLGAGLQAHQIVRVRLVETSQARHQPQRRERVRDRDAQRPGAGLRPQALERGGDVQQRAVHPGKQRFAFRRQPHAARHPLEQRKPQLLFQRFDLVRIAVSVTVSSAAASLKLRRRAADSKVRNALTGSMANMAKPLEMS